MLSSSEMPLDFLQYQWLCQSKGQLRGKCCWFRCCWFHWYFLQGCDYWYHFTAASANITSVYCGLNAWDEALNTSITYLISTAPTQCCHMPDRMESPVLWCLGPSHAACKKTSLFYLLNVILLHGRLILLCSKITHALSDPSRCGEESRQFCHGLCNFSQIDGLLLP